MNNQKIFELPYNFDKQLINFLDLYFINRKDTNIHAIYFPPFKEDYIAAKQFVEQENTHGPLLATYPKTREEYIDHILYIQKSFPNQLMLLLQHPTNILSDQLLEWYLTNFNITKFCVGNIEQAKQLKNYNPNFEIIGSITMKIDKQKLLSNEDYFKYFNGFVLWFPFNRDLDAIAELPKDFKYVLLANGGCHIYCTGTQHWYAKSFEEDQACFKKCNLSQLRKNPVTSMTVRPMDLQFFDPFITYYKIQGREWTTQRLIKHIVIYDVNTESIYPCVNYYPELYHQRLEYKTDVE